MSIGGVPSSAVVASLLVAALAGCGAGQKGDAPSPHPAPAPDVKTPEERHAERTETAVFGLCSLLTQCAVLQGEAMGDELSEEDRAALGDKRVLEANTASCVDEQMNKSALSPRQVGVVESCVDKYAAELTYEQCQGELFECISQAEKQD